MVVIHPQITQIMITSEVSTIRVSEWDKEASFEKLVWFPIPFAYANGTDSGKSA